LNRSTVAEPPSPGNEKSANLVRRVWQQARGGSRLGTGGSCGAAAWGGEVEVHHEGGQVLGGDVANVGDGAMLLGNAAQEVAAVPVNQVGDQEAHVEAVPFLGGGGQATLRVQAVQPGSDFSSIFAPLSTS
jgi:hypothetical protein